MSFDEAYEKVSKSRKVNPNDGFVSQLRCFEKMDFTYNPSSEAYKEFQSQYGKCSYLSTKFLSLQLIWEPKFMCIPPFYRLIFRVDYAGMWFVFLIRTFH